jgi:hypothetical protein
VYSVRGGWWVWGDGWVGFGGRDGGVWVCREVGGWVGFGGVEVCVCVCVLYMCV